MIGPVGGGSFSASAMHRGIVRRPPPITDLLDNLPWFTRYNRSKENPEGAGWVAWRAFLCALYGLPMTQQEYDIFVQATGRVNPPTQKAREAWVPTGRRARKSAITGLIAVYEGAYRDHRKYLAPGERARIPVLAKDKDDAGAIFGFAKAILLEPTMRHLLQKDPIAETIELITDCDIQIKAFGHTAGRSRAVPFAALDELAFWQNDKESKLTDEDVIKGIKFAMSNTPDPLLLGASSPYAERGLLFERFEKYHGEKNAKAAERDRVLVWQASTLTMHDNPTIRAFVSEEYRKDPIAADAEVGAQFRKDVVDYISRDVVAASVMTGVKEIPPCRRDKVRPGEESGPRFVYYAFVDPSGGGADQFTLAIAHYDPEMKRDGGGKGKAVLDMVRAYKAPIKPSLMVRAVCKDVKRYGLSYVTGDAYAGEWPRERFADRKVNYVVSPSDKHEIYKDLLPALNSGEVALLDLDEHDPALPDLLGQLKKLRRKTTPNGRDIIDHPPGGHDDVINSAAGALLQAYNYGQFQEEAPPPEVYATTEEILEKQIRDLEDEVAARGREDERGDQWLTRWQG